MDLVPVFVADWEMECCGEPFALGSAVSWRLVFHREQDVATPPEALLALDPAGPRGALFATWHGDGCSETPPVAAAVRRIRLVRQPVRRDGRGLTPLAAGAQFTELPASRARFDSGARRTPPEPWAETGLIVDLALDLGDVLEGLFG